jgi:heptosyltransferase-1
MRVLLIKTSSMGDVIHTLPALTDAAAAIPGITFDWVVEKSFADIPPWHPSVGKVIPISLRRWRKNIFSKQTRDEWKQFREQIRDQQYDLILDAQGLVKSAFLTWFAKGTRAGLDWSSARESLASLAYQQKYTVNFYQHAIVRMRSLFAHALGYAVPTTAPDYGLQRDAMLSAKTEGSSQPYLVFMHGTTWESKLWPESYWMQLADMAAAAGYRIKISGASEAEVARAARIAAHCSAVDAMPRLTIKQMAGLLLQAKGAVAVDTGFGHLAAALDLPLVTIYGSTNPDYTSAVGKRVINLAAQFACSPCLSRVCTYKQPSDVAPACYATLPPLKIWQTLQSCLMP